LLRKKRCCPSTHSGGRSSNARFSWLRNQTADLIEPALLLAQFSAQSFVNQVIVQFDLNFNHS